MSSYDIGEQQVCVYFDDPGHCWHIRILLVPLGAGRWLACSSDYDVEIIDLALCLVIPLERAQPLPARVLGDHYAQQPLRPDALERARIEARALATALGVAPAAAPVGAALRMYADTGHERFGQAVEQDLLLQAARLVQRDGMGLLEVPEEGWTFVERVRPADLSAWREEKVSGPGRDGRILPVTRDAQRSRFCTVRDALGKVVPLPVPAPEDWPYKGPSAVYELLVSVRAVSDDFGQFHEHFLRTSGLGGETPVGIKHRELLGILMHLVCFDQLNVCQLAGAEACARFILQIHAAVRRNPKAPDFRGLAMMTMSRLDCSGGVLTGEFAKYVAEEQKSDAFTLKQQRLYAEEDDKRRAGAKKGGGKDKDP